MLFPALLPPSMSSYSDLAKAFSHCGSFVITFLFSFTGKSDSGWCISVQISDLWPGTKSEPWLRASDYTH